MYNFGDEITIESYRIPWLVWIQVMAMVLLLILLYCFSLLVIDLSNDDVTTTTTTTTTKPSSSTSRLVSDGIATSTTLVTNRLQNSQVGESIKGEIVRSTSRTMRREEIAEMEEASAAAAAAAAHIYFHPCYYFRLARIAFLKCLGFDSTSEGSSTPQRGKTKES